MQQEEKKIVGCHIMRIWFDPLAAAFPAGNGYKGTAGAYESNHIRIAVALNEKFADAIVSDLL